MKGVWVVTGPPGVGKSTLVSKVVLRLKSAGVIVGGCVTSERRKKGARIGFELRDLTNGTQGELASLDAPFGPKVGRYRVNLKDLASIGARGLSDAAARAEVIVIDELGPMELTSPEFRRGVKASLDSGKPVLVVVHERLDDELLNGVRASATESFELTTMNRDDVTDQLSSALLAAAGGPKAS
ncbi:MAG: NTPase [Thaumarchaeota archaeon]|nr:NTPase [Nitrososphaerota archaeon]